jgi:hypothetical protein
VGWSLGSGRRTQVTFKYIGIKVHVIYRKKSLTSGVCRKRDIGPYNLGRTRKGGKFERKRKNEENIKVNRLKTCKRGKNNGKKSARGLIFAYCGREKMDE